MALTERIENDIRAYMRSGERNKLEALRLLRSRLKNRLIETRSGSLADEEVLAIVAAQVKRHRESIEKFRQGRREDLVDVELEQLSVLERYLPEALSEQEVEALITEAITEARAVSADHLGDVMKLLMPKVRGRFDGKELHRRVLARLGGGREAAAER